MDVMRPISALLVVIMLALSACGGERRDPRSFPTVTPTAITSVSGIGEVLAPLSGGRTVVAGDGRYSFVVPPDWTAAQAPPAEEFWVEPGAAGTTRGTALSANIVRETPSGISTAQQYAEAGRGRVASIFKDVVTLSFSPVRLGDHQAWRWVYTADTGARVNVYYQYFVIDGAQGFVLTGTAPSAADYSATQRLFDGIAGSLTFVRG